MRRGEILVKRVGPGLFPADARSAKELRKIPARTPFAIRTDRSRSTVQNSLYWSVLEAVVAATGRWRTAEALHVALKVATGHVDIVQLIDGRMVKVPESTSFQAMNQDEFQAYMDAAFRVICDEVLGGMAVEDLLSHTLPRAA